MDPRCRPSANVSPCRPRHLGQIHAADVGYRATESHRCSALLTSSCTSQRQREGRSMIVSCPTPLSVTMARYPSFPGLCRLFVARHAAPVSSCFLNASCTAKVILHPLYFRCTARRVASLCGQARTSCRIKRLSELVGMSGIFQGFCKKTNQGRSIACWRLHRNAQGRRMSDCSNPPYFGIENDWHRSPKALKTWSGSMFTSRPRARLKCCTSSRLFFTVPDLISSTPGLG